MPHKKERPALIGILALQGDFSAHQKATENWADVVLIKTPDALHAIDGLIIPGGESSALLHLMERWSFLQAIKDFHQSGGAIFGTCAGLILMATSIEPQQKSLALLDVSVERNAYGRQQESFVDYGQWCDDLSTDEPLPMAFIRAPKITRVGPSVKVLASCRQSPVLVQDKRLLASSFHPEESVSSMIHQYFLKHCVPAGPIE
jgi:pyridoxal 5'-phosphate synthase pdxT subunit